MKQTRMGGFMSRTTGASAARADTWADSPGVTSYFRDMSKRDTEEYRRRYPGKKDHEDRNDNLRFYTNELKSSPDGGFIDTIHRDWFEDYKRLERHHGYIQWLFPIRESGMNWSAQELQLHEAEAIMNNPKAHERVLTSYKMMLNFYGMHLVDAKTGEIQRAPNWKERFEHLNRSFHNYLRITRILKSLGEFGYEHLKFPFLSFVLKEAFLERTLCNTIESLTSYWLETLRNDDDRKKIRRYLYKLQHTKSCRPESESDEYSAEEDAEESKVKTKIVSSVEKPSKEDNSGLDRNMDDITNNSSHIKNGSDKTESREQEDVSCDQNKKENGSGSGEMEVQDQPEISVDEKENKLESRVETKSESSPTCLPDKEEGHNVEEQEDNIKQLQQLASV